MSSRKARALISSWESRLANRLQKIVDASDAFCPGDKVYVSINVSGGKRVSPQTEAIWKVPYYEAITNQLTNKDWDAIFSVLQGNGSRDLAAEIRKNANSSERVPGWVGLDAALARTKLPFRVRPIDFVNSRTRTHEWPVCIWKCKIIRPGKPIPPPS